MGFGLLLCAYFILTLMTAGLGTSNWICIFYMIGAMVTVPAVERLKEYNPRFVYLYPVSLTYCLVAVYHLLLELQIFFLWDIPFLESGALEIAASAVQFAAELAYAVIALWSSAEIAASVNLEKHRARALRNIIFVGIGAVGQILIMAIPALATAGNEAVVKILLLYQLLVYVLNAYCFYTCFSSICPPGEEFGKPSKKSRFKFINRINEKLDAKNEQARLQYEKDLAEQNKKYSAKNNNRHHKKKK